MNERYKRQIKDLNAEGLKKELEDKLLELMKVTNEAKKYGYAPSSTNAKFHGNIERVKKHIAILKTKLKELGVVE